MKEVRVLVYDEDVNYIYDIYKIYKCRYNKYRVLYELDSKLDVIISKLDEKKEYNIEKNRDNIYYGY